MSVTFHDRQSKPTLDRKHWSFADPLIPVAPISQVRPVYEDRVLVKRLPWPGDTSDTVIEAPAMTRRTNKGIQFGEVVAVGPGASGQTKFTFRNRQGPQQRLVRFRDGERREMQVKPGDRVYYQREERQEFLEGEDMYSFLFEEQHILAVIE